MGRREGKCGMRNYLVLHRILGEANKGLGKAPKSCTRKEHESVTNSIAKRGQGAIAPCRVKGQRPLWGLGQRPNCSAGDQHLKRTQQRRRQRSVPAPNFARPQTRPQAALPLRFREKPRIMPLHVANGRCRGFVYKSQSSSSVSGESAAFKLRVPGAGLGSTTPSIATSTRKR